MNDKCPNCGYCPHCGRGGYQTYPVYPQPYTWDAQPTINNGQQTAPLDYPSCMRGNVTSGLVTQTFNS